MENSVDFENSAFTEIPLDKVAGILTVDSIANLLKLINIPNISPLSVEFIAEHIQ